MLDKFAGYKTQIRVLEKKLKEMDHAKLSPAKVKEVTEAIQNLKTLVKEKEDKKVERKKKKEDASKPADAVEAAVVPTEVVKESSPVPTEEVVKESSVEKWAIDSKVESSKGMGSWGYVMRNDWAPENPGGLVYVAWQEGTLKERDVFGGYYKNDLKLKAEVVAEAKDPTDYVPREQLYNLEADLKSNYEGMIRDLQEEIKMAHDKGELTWVGRLEKKLADIQKSYDEKYNKTAEDENGSGGSERLKVVDLNPAYDKDPQEKATGYGGDRPYGANVCPNGEENSLPLEGSLKQALDKMDPNPLNMADKYYCNHCGYSGKDFHFINVDKDPSKHSGLACPKCHKEVALNNPKHSSLKLADMDLNSIDKRYAIYLKDVSYPAARTLTYAKAQRMAKEKFPEQLAAGNVEIKREDFKEASLDVKADNDAQEMAFERAVDRLDKKLMKGDIHQEEYDAEYAKLKKEMFPKEISLYRDANLDKQAINITVGEKLFIVNPLQKTADNEYVYDVNLADNSKLFKITSKDEMGQEHLAYVIEKELTKEASTKLARFPICQNCADANCFACEGGTCECPNCKGKGSSKEKKSSLAKLTSNLAFLKKGSLVSIIAVDNAKKQIKFASLDNSLRGWAPSQKFSAMDVPEAKLIDHEGHKDEILGESGNELLVTCPSGSNNVIFREITAPPATPESLNDMESSLKEAGPMWCSEHGCKNKGYWPSVKGSRCDKHKIENEDTKKQSAKECSHCNGTGFKTLDTKPNDWVTECSFCKGNGSESSKKAALEEEVQEESQPDFENDIFIQSEGQLGAKTVAYQGGKRIAVFDGNDYDKFYSDIKNWMEAHSWFPSVWIADDHGGTTLDTSFYEWMNKNQFKTSSLNKSAHIRHEDGKWVVYNHDYKKTLGSYPTKEEALKRLRQVEYFKSHKGSLQPLSKKESSYFDPDWTTKKVGEFADEMAAEKFMMHNFLENGFYRKEGDKYIVYNDVPKDSVTSKKEAKQVTKCVKPGCDKEQEPKDMIENVHGAGYLCKEHAKAWNKDASLKKADQNLEQQIQGFKDRMSAVTERLSNPPVKQASELDETPKGEDAITTSELIESLERGIDLLEGKTSDQLSPEEHHNLEEMENLLWKVEDSLGLSHPLPEHEMKEPEHAQEAKVREEEFKAPEATVEKEADAINNPPATPAPAGSVWLWDGVRNSWYLAVDPNMAGSTGTGGTY